MAKDSRQILFEGHYGVEDPWAIHADVDLFEEFYVSEFGDELKDILIRRTKSSYSKWGILAIVLSFLFYLPLFLTPELFVAKLIAVMGVMVLGAGIFLCVRAVRAQEYVERKFADKVEAEFSSTRTILKRVLDYVFYDDGVFIHFGVKGKTRQKRSKLYSELSGVYETDQILFMKGLTWVSRFQLGDERFEQIKMVLRRECANCYHVTGFSHNEETLNKIVRNMETLALDESGDSYLEKQEEGADLA